MAVLFDARGNEIAAPLDVLGGNAVTDARTITFTQAALNAETIVTLNGQTTVTVDARSGAFAGTIVGEATIDGVNWFSVPWVSLTTQLASTALVLTGASSNQVVAHVGGCRAFRVRCSAYTSGTLTVACRGTVAALRPSLERPYPTTLWVTATAAANTSVTATLPAAGAGLCHYITHIEITRNATAALAGSATLVHTTTNLPGSPAWSVGNDMTAGGTRNDVNYFPAAPLKSSAANVATTIVAPAAGAAVLTRINVGYFVGA